MRVNSSKTLMGMAYLEKCATGHNWDLPKLHVEHVCDACQWQYGWHCASLLWTSNGKTSGHYELCIYVEALRVSMGVSICKPTMFTYSSTGLKSGYLTPFLYHIHVPSVRLVKFVIFKLYFYQPCMLCNLVCLWSRHHAPERGITMAFNHFLSLRHVDFLSLIPW